MAENDQDILIVDDCGCGCHCNDVELRSDHQPDVLLFDEYAEAYENDIVHTRETVDDIKETVEEILEGQESLATEENATANKEEVIAKIEEKAIDPTPLAKEATSQQILTQATNAAADAAAAKTAAQAITGYAKETNATQNKEAVISTVNTAKAAMQGANTNATLTAIKTAVDAINLDTNGLAREENATANKEELSRQIDYYGDQIERVTEDTVEAAKKDIKGADSTKTFDCGASIPACSFDGGSYWDIYLDSDTYWFDNESQCEFPEEDIEVGTVLRATEVDAEEGYLLCTSFTNPTLWLTAGNVKKSGDDYYLDTSGGATFVAVEANKNYRCKEVVELKYIKITLPVQTITGYLYIWEEYEGENIHDGVEKINAHTTAEVTDRINTIDADYAEQLANIIGTPDESESESEVVGTSQTEQQISELRTLRESYDELADKTADSQEILAQLQNLSKLLIIPSLGGYKLSGGIYATSLLDFSYKLSQGSTIIEIYDDTTTSIGSGDYASSVAASSCTKIAFTKLTDTRTVANSLIDYFYGSNSIVEELRLPKVEYVGTYQLLRYFSALKLADYSSLVNGINANSYMFAGSLNLIDVWFGKNASGNVLFLDKWSPTNVLASADQTATLLANIRDHIAAQLPDRTGTTSANFQFSAGIKSAITNEVGGATAQAFSNKNWTII